MSAAPSRSLPRSRRRDCAAGALRLAVSLALVLLPRLAHAQDRPSLSGTWTSSGVSESWSVKSWGEACGPRPKGAGGGGGKVTVSEQGSELSIVGGGRAWSTAECWDPMPGLSRTSHSASPRAWSTRCTTPPSDPRRATVVTTVSATDTSIVMSETGDYQFVIQGTVCSASVRRSRSLSRPSPEPDKPEPLASAPAVSAPAPARPKPCAEAGEPARLEIAPARKLLRAGEAFSLRARVIDEKGCPLPTRPSFTVAEGPLSPFVKVDASGKVEVDEGAPEGEAEVVATVAGKGARVKVEVVSEASYEALLATRGMNDAGESEGVAVAVIATGTVGGTTTAIDDPGKARKRAFIALVVGAAAVLAFLGLALLRRGRRAAERAEGRESLFVPERLSGDTGEGAVAEPVPPAASKPRGKICPVCGALFEAEAQFCGEDGAVLVPVN